MEQTVETKSFRFALRIVKLCEYLRNEKKEFTLSKQLLRAGTSIGANVAESQQAQSRLDFVNKLNIALKKLLKPITGSGFCMLRSIYQKQSMTQLLLIVRNWKKCSRQSSKQRKSKVECLT